MNVKEYIESGILELYVMGALPAEEALEVARLSNQYPDLQAEIQAIEAALIRYAELECKNPDDRALDGALAELGLQSKAATIGKVVGMRKASFPWAVAASLALLVSLVGNGLLFNQLNTAKKEVNRLEALENTLNQDVLAQQTSFKQLENQLKTIENPDNLLVKLPGTAGSPNALATVYWNQETHEIALLMREVPQVPTAHQLQLWAIIDGVPVDAGVFDPVNGLHTLKNITGTVTTFAVTIEPMGGSVNPTLDQMIVAGNVVG